MRSALATLLLSLIALTLVGLGSSYSLLHAASPEEFLLVSDRPGYADATASVSPYHWHIELGTDWTPAESISWGGLVRFGLPRQFELRLATPTFMQDFAVSTPLDPDPATPELALGGASLGTKWSHQWSETSFSTSLMIGLPSQGISRSIYPDRLLSLSAQLSHQLNQKMNTGIAVKYGLVDGTLEAQESQYAEDLDHLFGVVGSIGWQEIDWSLFGQAGAELFGERVTPLIGLGSTLRVSRMIQVDLSLDLLLTEEGVTPHLLSGATIGW